MDNAIEMKSLANRKTKNPKVLLLYPPNQSWPGYMCKPNGSLAYPCIGGALIDEGLEVDVYDACVGNEKDDLDEVFYNSTELSSGLIRTGVSEQRILDEVSKYDVIGLTSIFTDQESIVLSTARLIKKEFPEKLVLSGGFNARHRLKKFLNNGVDIVCLSEAEKTIIHVINALFKGKGDLSKISSVAYINNNNVVINKTVPEDIIINLDELPMPAWELLPNERYWSIGRPHGGHFDSVKELRYGSLMTSLGCVFSCYNCHISSEGKNSVSGNIGKFRIKSDQRVIEEFKKLIGLGVKQVFIEDDTFFGNKKRAIRLLKEIEKFGVDIFPMNGVNLTHLFNGNEPDVELLEALKKANFKELVLPFETGSYRIMKKYLSMKFDFKNKNVKELLRVCKELGFTTSGNYMIGWPDETLDEINETLEIARLHKSYGLDSVYPLIVIPLPGTPLFDIVEKNGQLPGSWDTDRINWTKANLINTCVENEKLEKIRQSLWLELNDDAYVKYKQSMNVDQKNEI